MPRKSKKTLSRSEGVPEPVKRATLNLLNWLPPNYLLGACVTLDQQTHWYNVKQEAQTLRLYLKAYFEGGAPPKLDHLPPKVSRQITALAALYIDFYGMCFWNWEVLGKRFENLPEEPGDMLLGVIADDQIQMAEIPLKPFFQYIPDRHRRLNALEVQFQRGEISPEEFDQRSAALIRGTGTAAPSLMLQIYSACKLNATCKTTSKRGLDAITQFARSWAELEAATASRLHPRDHPQAITWIEGRRIS